jgi:glucuronoarabinoxylan endo-1,4-beta-xylanase
VIDGFGAATNGRSLTPAQVAFFFSPGSGDLGLSLLRTVVPDDGSCSTVNARCAGEVNNMQLAIADGARVWSTPWSPPSSMKTNGSTICNIGIGAPSPSNPSGSLRSSSYSAYADYLANYVKSLSSLYGIQLYALSVQNEPDVCPTYYDGATWSSANLHDFIRNNLGPTFVADGLTGTLVMMPESSGGLNRSMQHHLK